MPCQISKRSRHQRSRQRPWSFIAMKFVDDDDDDDSAQQRWTIWVPNVTAAVCRTMLNTTYKQGTKRGWWWELASQLQQQRAVGSCSVLCACHYLLAETPAVVPVITCCTLVYKFPPEDNAKSLLMPVDIEYIHLNRLKQSQPAPPPLTGDRLMVTVHPHLLHIVCTVVYWESLVYCSTLGGTFDRIHWPRSTVDNVMIIDHFVKWLRQA